MGPATQQAVPVYCPGKADNKCLSIVSYTTNRFTKGIKSLCARLGPRRFNKLSRIPAGAGWSKIRKGAILAVYLAWVWRNKKNKTLLCRAAHCNRLRAMGRMLFAQHSNRAQASCCKIFSAVHKVSFALGVRTHHTGVVDVNHC